MMTVFFFANNNEAIVNLCKCLATKFLLQDDGDIKNFLNINISHWLEPDNSLLMTMTQTTLINQILNDMGLFGKIVTQKRTQAEEDLQAQMLLLLMLIGITNHLCRTFNIKLPLFWTEYFS
jgi:hypothetical protein